MKTKNSMAKPISKQGRIFFVGILSVVTFVFSLAGEVSTNAGTDSGQKGAETPEKLVKQIAEYCSAGNSTNLLGCFDVSTKVREIGAKSFVVTIELAKAKAELRDALLKKFSPEQVGSLSDTYVLPVGLDPLKRLSEAFQKPTIKVKGDNASVLFGDRPQSPLNLEKKNKRWFVVRELDGLGAANSAEAFDVMEANRYLALGIRDCLKIVSEIKTIEEAEPKFTEMADKQVAIFWKESEARQKK